MIVRTSVPVIIDAAEQMVKRAGSRKPEEICRAYRIELLDMDLKKRLKAYYFYQSRIHNIIIDQNITDIFRRILIAHELGHFALHKKIAMMKGFQELEVLEKRDSEPLETEANLFASELLLPDDDVLECLKEYSFFETAAMLNVPAALLDFKYLTLKEKGCSLNAPDIRRAAFLKDDAGAYEPQDRF